MKLKKVLALVLCVCMVLGTMSFTVSAEEAIDVAKIGDVPYKSLAEALNDANDGDTVTLVSGPDQIVSAAGVVCGKTVTITGTAKFDWSKGWLYVGRGGEGDGKLIFDNAVITTGVTSSSYGIHVSGAKKGDSTTHYGEVEFINSDIELSYFINRNKATVNGGKLFVENGFAVTGRPASETPDGNAGVAQMNVINGAEVTVKNMNGMGIGHESNGIFNVEDSSFKSINSKFSIYQNSEFNVSGDVSINIPEVTNGGTVDAKGDVTFTDSVIGGTVNANGNDLTFNGTNEMVSLGAGSNNTFTINKGASLAITKSSRSTLGHGNTFNIYGNIENAKTDNTAELTPSLYIPGGASITGAGINFNVENAYFKFDTYISTKNTDAYGEFNFNFKNSIVESTSGKLAFFEGVGRAPIYNFTLKDSKLTIPNYLTFNESDCNAVIDNSIVNVTQLENCGTLTIKNGSEVNCTVAESQNATNPGTVVVDNAAYKASGNFTSAAGTGKLIVKNGGLADVTKITASTVVVDGASKLKSTAIDSTSSITIDLSNATAGNTFIECASLAAPITYKSAENAKLDENFTVIETYVASVTTNGVTTPYTNLVDAFKAVAENSVVKILSDVTISDKWNCNLGRGEAKGTFNNNPVTIEGNGHTLKFTGTIDDGYNQMAVFRSEADLTVKNLTIDMSEAISVFQNKFSAISTEANNLTVEGCTFIGSKTYTSARAIIFGEGAKDNKAIISVTDCDFIDWKYGIVDNMNGNDVAAVSVTGSDFTNASINISAAEDIKFTNNVMDNSWVIITSYADVNNLTVVATGNTLEEDSGENINYIKAAEIETDGGFNLPVADINGKKYLSLQEAVDAANGETIVVTANVSDEEVTVTGDVTIVAYAPVAAYALVPASAEDITLNNVTFDVQKDAGLSLDGFAVRGLSYIYANSPESISVTNCDIDTTTENVGNNCPPAFINFTGDANWETMSVELVFANNTLKVQPKPTDGYKYAHGIAGWNTIESATITGNTFGSETAPLSAAAVKLMNFTEGATVTVSENTFYVNSKDTGYGPNALQLYQNNSRGKNYSAKITKNAFYVDEDTAAVGVNINGMGDPSFYTGGATVDVAKDNTVNGRAIVISDVIAFGNGINNEGYQRGYVGVGVKYDAAGKITAGDFTRNSLGLEAKVAEGYHVFESVFGHYFVSADMTISFEREKDGLYNIVLTAADDIYEFVGAEFKFNNTSKTTAKEDMEYEILGIAGQTSAEKSVEKDAEGIYTYALRLVDGAKRMSGKKLIIGQVQFHGHGTINFDVSYGKVVTTEFATNLGQYYTTADETLGVVAIKNNAVLEKKRNVAVNVAFNHAFVGGHWADDMFTVTIKDGFGNVKTQKLEVAPNAKTGITTFENVQLGRLTVTLEAPGFRKYVYYTTLEEGESALVLNFWNNVKRNEAVGGVVIDPEEEIETGKGYMTDNFLVGDIVMDYTVDEYDLAAVTSYYGTYEIAKEEAAKYIKYDLNRDGNIDIIDVHYVLHTLNN